MLSQEAIQKILGIEEEVHLDPARMASKLAVTFYPLVAHQEGGKLASFARRLEKTFLECGVAVVPFEHSFERIPLRKTFRRLFRLLINNLLCAVDKVTGRERRTHYVPFRAFPFLLRRKRFKAGISIVVVGEQHPGNLPMEFIRSFKENSVISILPFPKEINTHTAFHEHFDTAMSLFAYHMTNIVLAVGDSNWILYNFNASHPSFDLEKDFKKNVLHALIPKIYAPISPHTFKEFRLEGNFDVHDADHREAVEDLVTGAALFGKTALYPKGKKIDELPFRNDFYRWIGKLHLDNRNGMSYGFLAHQLPTRLYGLVPYDSPSNSDYFEKDGNMHVVLDVGGRKYSLRVPEVAVLTQRSGSDKTCVNPEKDILKMGIRNGRMYLQFPKGVRAGNDYKPSFDTKVILAHAVGNALISSVLMHVRKDSVFLSNFRKGGLALAHWHGYIHPAHIPKHFTIHGIHNPHVSCSSPQSAIYALQGKLESFGRALQEGSPFEGDIHVEPQHGVNVTFPTLRTLATTLADNPKISTLGNEYLYLYN